MPCRGEGEAANWEERIRHFDERVRRIRLVQQLDHYKVNRDKVPSFCFSPSAPTIPACTTTCADAHFACRMPRTMCEMRETLLLASLLLIGLARPAAAFIVPSPLQPGLRSSVPTSGRSIPPPRVHSGARAVRSQLVLADTNAKAPASPRCYVVVNNLQSGGNIGRIVRSASIFGAAEVVVVGQRKWRLHGLHGYVSMPSRHFYTLDEAHAYLTGECSATIVGVEIEEGAKPLVKYDQATGVASFPFSGNTAFVVGNEGTGMSVKQRAICSSFVYIPHVRGGGGSGSLNVACACAIVLQTFAMWAGYPEAPRDGDKFGDDVEDPRSA